MTEIKFPEIEDQDCVNDIDLASLTFICSDMNYYKYSL